MECLDFIMISYKRKNVSANELKANLKKPLFTPFGIVILVFFISFFFFAFWQFSKIVINDGLINTFKPIFDLLPFCIFPITGMLFARIICIILMSYQTAEKSPLYNIQKNLIPSSMLIIIFVILDFYYIMRIKDNNLIRLLAAVTFLTFLLTFFSIKQRS
jgi:hypothetical protein